MYIVFDFCEHNNLLLNDYVLTLRLNSFATYLSATGIYQLCQVTRWCDRVNIIESMNFNTVAIVN